MIEVLAKDLRAGDRLEPDGTQVIRTTVQGRFVELLLKAPGERALTYTVDRNWPLRQE